MESFRQTVGITTSDSGSQSGQTLIIDRLLRFRAWRASDRQLASPRQTVDHRADRHSLLIVCFVLGHGELLTDSWHHHVREWITERTDTQYGRVCFVSGHVQKALTTTRASTSVLVASPRQTVDHRGDKLDTHYLWLAWFQGVDSFWQTVGITTSDSGSQIHLILSGRLTSISRVWYRR